MIIGRISGIRPAGYPAGYPVPVTGYPAGYRIAKKAGYPAGYPAGRISGATLIYIFFQPGFEFSTLKKPKNGTLLDYIESILAEYF